MDTIEGINFFLNLLSSFFKSLCSNKKVIFPSNKQQAVSLKSLELEGLDLTKTPDVSSFLSLEILMVTWRSGLVEIHPSIGYLDSLKSLELAKYQFLIGNVIQLPSSICKCKALSRLVITGLNIERLPKNIGDLKFLTTMQITKCPGLENLPDSICGLESLCHLCLCGNGITQLPKSISKLTKLINLDVSSNELRGLPATICDLVHLQELKVSQNKDLRVDLLVEIVNLSRLKTLSLEGCDKIQELPDLPVSLTELKTSSWLPRAVSNFSSLTNLVNLWLSSDRGHGVDPQVWDGSTMSWIQHLQKLEYLTIQLPGTCVVCSGLDKLSRLKKFNLVWENPLSIIEFFTVSGSSLTNMRLNDGWWCLASLEIKDCEFLERVDDISVLYKLKHLEFSGCPRLVEIGGVEQLLESLQALRLLKCDSIPCLPNPSLTETWSSPRLLVKNCRMLRNYLGPYEDYFLEEERDDFPEEEEEGDFLEEEEEEEDELSISRRPWKVKFQGSSPLIDDNCEEEKYE